MFTLQQVTSVGLLGIVSHCMAHYFEGLRLLFTKGNQLPLTQEHTGISFKSIKLMVSTQVQLVLEQSENKIKMVIGLKTTIYHL